MLSHKYLYFYTSTECKYFCHMCAPHHPALTKSPVLSQWKPHLSVRLSVRLRVKGLLDCVTHFSADSTKGKFNTGTNMLTDISISEILAGHSSVSPELFHFSFFLPLLVVCDENPLSFCVSIAGTNYGDKMSSFSSSVYLTFQSWPRSYDNGNKNAAVGTSDGQ